MPDSLTSTAVVADSPSIVGRWLSLARAAAIVVVIWAVTLQFTVGILIPIVLALGAVFAVFVPFLSGERRRVGLALAIVAALAIAGNVPSLVEELSHPSSAEAFIPMLISVTAAVVTAVAGAGAFFRWSPAPVRPIVGGSLVLIVLGSAFALGSAATVDSVSAAPEDIAVTAKHNEFEPSVLIFSAGAAAVWVDNQDDARHTFTIDELGVGIDVPGNSSQRVEFVAEPGEYRAYCAVSGHAGMQLTLEVQ